MIEKSLTISCNGQIIADHIFILETIKEKEHGMRGRHAEAGTAMLFIFPKVELLLFNMLGVWEPLGIIVLDENNKIKHAGVMRPWIGGYLGWGKYVIEVIPEAVENLEKGAIVSGLP